MTTVAPTPERRPAPPVRAMPSRLPALDGLRAVAVIGVLLYHADVPWAQGGFLGVDVFFVLSGFLVTLLLVGGAATSGDRFDPRRFWVRRARRLVPAQVALVTVVTTVVAVAYREELADLRGQVVAALTGTMNWYLIATDSSYFDQLGRPPVLRHLWSLAIEMQFYLVFPVVLWWLLRTARHRLGLVAGVLAAGAVASAVLMAVLFQPGHDPSRAYYGSFSRLTGLLLGATLALFWRPGNLRRGGVRARGRAVDAAAVVGLVVLAVLLVRADGQAPWMYRGGFVLANVAALVVVAACAHPGTVVGGRSGLGHPVVAAVGLRSYGLYLWHWPVYAVTRPGIDTGLGWGPVFVLRIVATVGLTEACYRFVERPWHEGRAGLAPSDWFGRAERDLFGRPVSVVRPALAGIAAVAMVGSVLALATAPSRPDPIARSIRLGQARLAAEQRARAASARTSTTVDPHPELPRVTAVGDSVMLGAGAALLRAFGSDIDVDAAVGRRPEDVAAAIDGLAAEGRLRDVVVVQTGENGEMRSKDVRAIARAVRGRRLVFLTVRVPRSWEGEVNDTLRAVAPEVGARVLDWKAVADGHPGWFYGDGAHLKHAGVEGYAHFLAAALAKGVP